MTRPGVRPAEPAVVAVSSCGREAVASVDIDAPMAVVWRHLVRFSDYPSWNPFIVSADGELVVGETVSVRYVAGGRRHVAEAAVERVSSRMGFAMTLSSPLPMQPSMTVVFAGAGLAASRTRFTASTILNGFVPGFLARKHTARITAPLRMMCDALAVRCEMDGAG